MWVGPVGGGGGGVIDVSLVADAFFVGWCVVKMKDGYLRSGKAGRNNHPAVAAAPTL